MKDTFRTAAVAVPRCGCGELAEHKGTSIAVCSLVFFGVKTGTVGNIGNLFCSLKVFLCKRTTAVCFYIKRLRITALCSLRSQTSKNRHKRRNPDVPKTFREHP